MTKYPNITWTLEKKRLPHYEFAAQVKIERTRFSRGLHGATEFTPTARARIANELGFDVTWLFDIPKPPKASVVDDETTAATIV